MPILETMVPLKDNFKLPNFLWSSIFRSVFFNFTVRTPERAYNFPLKILLTFIFFLLCYIFVV